MASYQNAGKTFFSQIINLPWPYSTNCSKEDLFIFRNTRYNYSKPACMTQCLSRFVIKRCGCRPIEYPGETQNTLEKLTYDRLKNWFMLSVHYRVMDARGKFGEHERSVRDARGDSFLSFLSAVQTSQVHP